MGAVAQLAVQAWGLAIPCRGPGSSPGSSLTKEKKNERGNCNN